MSTAIVTTVSRSYLPLARVLMASAAEHHPEADRYVLLLDARDETVTGAQVLHPSDLVPDEHELTVLETIYKPIEYATALKAKLLTFALRSADQAYFLDPDMRLFAPMTSAAAALADGTGTLLTPHRVSPAPYANRSFYEWTFKTYGVYNTGFVAVTKASLPMLEWWDSRLRRDCLDDLSAPEWVDQLVMDLAPGYFDLDVFKDPAYNVGWWNLDERRVHCVDGRWFAGDGPLVLMHYSGVRPKRQGGVKPQLRHSAQNEVAPDAAYRAELEVLEDAYVADLMAAGYADYSTVEYGLTRTARGRVLTDGDRRHYLRAVLAAESRGERPPLPDDIAWGVRDRVVTELRTARAPEALLHDWKRLRGLRQVTS